MSGGHSRLCGEPNKQRQTFQLNAIAEVGEKDAEKEPGVQIMGLV